MDYKLIIALLIPFVGTTLGSAMVYLLKKDLNPKLLKLLLGFASGIMIASSIWSLLLPAIESYDASSYKRWLVPSTGFVLGIIFLLLLDLFVPHMHTNNKEEGVSNTHINKTNKLLLAVTIHNIPEGLAVGLVIAGALNNSTLINAALALSIGIAIQNFPEGTIVSTPLKETGISKTRAFIYGMLSGIVEPLAAVVAILFCKNVESVLPYALSFAAGAMIYVVADELIPQGNVGTKSYLSTIGLAIGFILMMILDIALG